MQAQTPFARADRRQSMPFGCETDDQGRYRFRLWAPAVEQILLDLINDAGTRTLPMERGDDGWHSLCEESVVPGERYCYRLPSGLCVPDPASRFQPEDVHGPSQVVDPFAFDWQDTGWRGRPWHEVVLYELHVGTFSPTGDFAGVEARLDWLRDLGVTAIELMPVADFPGRWNWGYDGALLFAPDARYGTPNDLKRLVQAAHRRGLMIVLDVVYNHFGPEGNYLHCYAPQFFHQDRHTPWGAAIDFDGPYAEVVREFFICNALFWLVEYGFDGLRLDAVDRIFDQSQPDILDELAARVHAGPGSERELHLVLENDHNDAARYRRGAAGAVSVFTAQWNDDFHHGLHALLTGEADGVYQDYADAPLERLGRALAEGFCYQGEPSAFRGGRLRGTPSRELPPSAFVNFSQNHDQIGNRAFGERLEHLIDERAMEAALALVCLAPAAPLFFMGQEFAAAAPFLFFCDLEPALMDQVVAGRRREFAAQAAFSDPARLGAMPSPGDQTTFEHSRLHWPQAESDAGRARYAFCRMLLQRRAEHIRPLLPGMRQGGTWVRCGARALAWRWPAESGEALCLAANLSADASAPEPPAAGLPWPVGRVVVGVPPQGEDLWPPWSLSCWISPA